MMTFGRYISILRFTSLEIVHIYIICTCTELRKNIPMSHRAPFTY